MKKINLNKNSQLVKTLAIIMLCTTPFLSCKKFLEKPIDDRTQIKSIDEIEKAIIGLTPHSDHYFTDLMTDDYSYKSIAGHVSRDFLERLTPIFTFDITRRNVARIEMTTSGFNPSTAFLRYYFRINNACLLIDRVNEIEITPANEKRLNNILAHAYAIRAYCNFMLTNLFGKQYNPNTANTDLAVPFIGEYNANAVVNRPRSTVEFMYQEIEKDWLKAIELIDISNTATKSKLFFSKKAIYGLLSRLYLNKKQWDKSIEYADLLLAIDNNPLPIKTFRANNVNKAEDYSKAYFNPENNAILLVGGNSVQRISFVNTGFYPYPLMQFYGQTARGVFGDFAEDEMIMSSILFDDKMPQKWLYFNATARQTPNMPLVTVDEVLFNHAEASIEKGGTVAINDATKTKLISIIDNLNFTAAAAARLKNELNAITTKSAAITYLLNLKRYRFFTEGVRWFDIKRHNLSVTHNFNGTDFKLDGTNPEEYVIKLPSEEIQFNPDSNN